MAKGQAYSSHQKGIIKRYYEHRDTLALQKLGERITDLYLCELPSKSEKLWQGIEPLLKSAGVKPERIKPILAQRDIEGLARLVGELTVK